MIISSCIHVAANGMLLFFPWLCSIPLHTYTHTHTHTHTHHVWLFDSNLSPSSLALGALGEQEGGEGGEGPVVVPNYSGSSSSH